MGDELVVTCPVQQGQGIAVFKGRMLTNDQSDRIAQGRRQYLITVGDDQVLDCGYYATMRPPMCFASLANQADGSVYSYHLNRHLTVEDNNSAVELFCEMGKDPREHTQAVLYALWPAEAFSIRMWHYGDDYRMPGAGPETPVPRTPVVRRAFQDVLLSPRTTTPATPHRIGRRFREKIEFLDNFGFSHFDAVPELAFENAHSEAVQAQQQREQEKLREIEETFARLEADWGHLGHYDYDSEDIECCSDGNGGLIWRCASPETNPDRDGELEYEAIMAAGDLDSEDDDARTDSSIGSAP